MSVSMAGMKNSEIVIGEGITEKFYILSLLDTVKIKPTPIVIKPYNMEELERAIKQYAANGYTKIHCLIDMDNKVDNDTNMRKYQRLKQKYDRKKVKKTECDVLFYESHPSIELFFYYYFENSTAEKTNNGLKSWLNHKCDYETKPKYAFHKTFVRKGGCLRTAITNAKNSVRLRPDNSFHCSFTEVGDLIDYFGVK